MNLEETITAAWNLRDQRSRKETITLSSEAVLETLHLLDQGKIRVAEFQDGTWITQHWIKQAVLLYFHWISKHPEKIPSKFATWPPERFGQCGFRVSPGAQVRYGAYVAPKAVLMPSFVNIGAYVGESTMIDTWATVGSYAQIGANCHISGGTGIGGGLEPIQEDPVIIEDNCFIGARSEIAEGIRVGKRSVIGMGVFISGSTKILDRETGKIHHGHVPAGSVVVSGSLPAKGGVSLYCAVIVKQVDEKTRSKTSPNELLREAEENEIPAKTR